MMNSLSALAATTNLIRIRYKMCGIFREVFHALLHFIKQFIQCIPPTTLYNDSEKIIYISSLATSSDIRNMVSKQTLYCFVIAYLKTLETRSSSMRCNFKFTVPLIA